MVRFNSSTPPLSHVFCLAPYFFPGALFIFILEERRLGGTQPGFRSCVAPLWFIPSTKLLELDV